MVSWIPTVICIVYTVVAASFLLFVCRNCTSASRLRMPMLSTCRLRTDDPQGRRPSFAAFDWHDARLLWKSNWFGSYGPYILLAYRLLIFSYPTVGFILEAAGPITASPGVYPTYMTFFTHWSWLLLLIHGTLGSVVSLRGVRRHRNPELDAKDPDMLDKVFMAVSTTMHTSALFLTVFYWPGAYDGEKIYFDSIMKHGGNVILLLIELLLSRMPFTTVWIVFPTVYATSYAIFMWIYWAAAEEWVYKRLDFREFLSIVGYVAITALMAVSFFIMFGLSKWRERLGRKVRNDSDDVSEGASTSEIGKNQFIEQQC